MLYLSYFVQICILILYKNSIRDFGYYFDWAISTIFLDQIISSIFNQ
jgi:hypothetical protein